MNFVRTKIFLLALVSLSGICAEPDFELEKFGIDKDLLNEVLIAQGKNPIMDQKPLGDPPVPPEDEIKPITDVLPIWGKQAREKGYNLPLPFGAALNYVYMNQGVDIADVSLDWGLGTGFQDYSDDITFQDAERIDHIGLFRFDTWLFPFLNIYGLFGRLTGDIKGVVNMDEDPWTGDPMHQPVTIPYTGYTYGFGLDLAGGYESFFFIMDSNFTWSNVDMTNELITAFTFSPKFGILIEDKELPGRGTIWAGAMYLNFKMEVTGDADPSTLGFKVPDELGTIKYSARIKPVGNWNMLIGGSWEITSHWLFLAEVGFINRTQFIMGGVYRF